MIKVKTIGQMLHFKSGTALPGSSQVPLLLLYYIIAICYGLNL